MASIFNKGIVVRRQHILASSSPIVNIDLREDNGILSTNTGYYIKSPAHYREVKYFTILYENTEAKVTDVKVLQLDKATTTKCYFLSNGDICIYQSRIIQLYSEGLTQLLVSYSARDHIVGFFSNNIVNVLVYPSSVVYLDKELTELREIFVEGKIVSAHCNSAHSSVIVGVESGTLYEVSLM